jgi:phospholipid/cholesterol/gamma-HCH transport system substrate-binding protein
VAAPREKHRVHPAWWAVILFAVIAAIVVVCSMLFAGTLRTFVPVTLTSERAGLVMESGAKVKLRGVEVGRVSAIKPATSRPTWKPRSAPPRRSERSTST